MGKIVKLKTTLSPNKEYELAVRVAKDSINKVVNWAYVNDFRSAEIESLVETLIILNKFVQIRDSKIQKKKA